MIDTIHKALFLNQHTFETLRDSPHVVRQGLLVVLVVGLLVGAINGIQSVIFFLNPTTALDQQREEFEDSIDQVLISSTSAEQREIYQQIRVNLPSGFVLAEELLTMPTPLPQPVVALAHGLGVMVSQPLSYLGWMLLGIIVTHIAAARMGGEGTIQQMVGLGALAAAPLALDALAVIPAIGLLVVLVARVWLLAIMVMATSVVHRFDSGRAALAVLFFPIIGLPLLCIAFCISLVAVGFLSAML